MATVTKTFTWDSDNEGFTLSIISGTGNSITRDTGNGSPTNGSILFTGETGRNKTGQGQARITNGTWTSIFGVPSGSTVNSIQIEDIRTYAGLNAWNVMDAMNFNVHLADNVDGLTDVTGLGSDVPIWSRNATAQDSGWVNAGQQTSRSVTSTYQAAATALDLFIHIDNDNGNNANATGTGHVDYFSITVDYTAGAGTVSGSFTADAVIEATQTGSFTIDANIYAPTAYDKLALDMDLDSYWPGDDPSGVLAERARERFNAVIAELSPTFHITMDDVAGAAAIDLTGNGHDGTYTGTPTTDTLDWTSDSGAMTVDRATGEGISIPDHADLDLGTSDYTWVLGVRIPATWYTTDWQAFFAKGSGNPYLFGTMTTSNQLGLYLVDTQYALPATTTLNDDKYHLLMVTLDRSGNVSLYVDGATTPEATADVSAKVSDDIQGANALNIGYGSGTTYAFSGGLQHLAGFKGTLLTGADFARLYKTRSLDGISAVSTATYGITGPTINSESQTAINPNGMMFQAPATSDGWGPFEQYDWQKGLGISMWVKASTDALTSGYLAGMVNDSAVHDRSFEMYYSSGRPQFYARSWPGDAPSWSDFALVADAVDDDTWHHVVMEIAPDTGKPRGWIDGTLVDWAGQSYRFNRWIGDTQMCLQIASGATVTGSQLNGIAKVAMRNRPFSASERDTLRLGTVSTAQNQSISLTGNIGPSADISAYDYFTGSRDAVDIHSTTADDGSTWGGSSGTDDFIVNGNRGRATVQYMQFGDYTDPTLRLGHTALGDTYVRALYGWDVDPVETRENNLSFVVSSRNNASGYGYHLEALHSSDGGINIQVRARDSSGWVTPWLLVNDAAAWTDHTTEKFWLELKTTGTNPNVTLEGRVWKDGDSYPTTADITSTGNNLTDIPSTGTSGFWAAANDNSQDNGAFVEAFEVEEVGPTTYSGSFTADANISATVSGSFTVDAEIVIPYDGPVLESSTELAVNNQAAPSVTLPTGTTAGDLLYMVIASANSVSINSIGDGTRNDYALRVDATPAHGDLDHHIYWKIAESGETAPTINFASAETTTVWLGRISGVNQTTPFDSAIGLSPTVTAVETSHTTASKTPSVDHTLVLATDTADIGTGDTAPNWTVDSGFTEDSDFHEAVQGQATVVAWKQVATAAATSATFTLIQDDWHSTTIDVIRPAPTGGTGSFTADAHIWNTDADYSDSFNRTVASGIGTSSGGDVWGGAGLTSYDVTPSYVHSTLNNAITSTAAVTLDHANVLNQRLRVLFSADRSPATSSLSIALALRHDGLQSSPSYYRANFRFESSDSKVDMFVDCYNAGSWTNLTSGSAWTEVGTWSDLSTEQWWVEAQVTNSNPTFIETRVWKDGDARPSSPSTTGSDSAANQDGVAGVTGFFWAVWDTTDTELRIHQWEVWDLGQHAFTIDGYVKTVESGSFTADAAISATVAGSFTADAEIQNTYSGSFTVDAYIERTYSGSFTADAEVLATTAGSFTADAAISATIESSFTADAEIQRTYSGSFTADAIISAAAIEGSFTADAYVQTVETGSFTADAHLSATIEGSFTADAELQRTFSGSFTADAELQRTFSDSFTADSHLSATVSGSFTADAEIQVAGTVTDNFTADAYIQTVESGSFTADADIQRTYSGSFTADAEVQNTYSGSFTADAEVQQTYSGSFTADGYVYATFTGAFAADAAIQQTYGGTFTADSHLSATVGGSFTADAWIQVAGTITDSFTADAYIQRTYSGSFTADAYIYETYGSTFTADAEVQRTFTGSFTADSEVQRTFQGSFTADGHLSNTIGGTFTIDAWILTAGTIVDSFTADAYIQTVGTGSFTADAYVQRTYGGTFTADAELQQTFSGSFSADAEVKATIAQTFTADAQIWNTMGDTFTVDAMVQRTYGGTFTVDADILGGNFGQFTADAYIRQTFAQTFTVDAEVQQTYSGSFTADSEVQRTEGGTFTYDSHLSAVIGGSFTLDAFLLNPDYVTPGVTFIVTMETDDRICDIQYSDPTATIDYA